MIGEGFDVAIRVRFPPLEHTELVMRKLARGGSVWSRALLWSAGVTLANPADLGGMPSLDLGPARREHVWRLERGRRTCADRARARLVTDDMAALRPRH